MALKAIFPTGANTLTLNGLYQWDYGRVLEIESADIGTQTVEIHFACQNMTEAIVRVCSFTNGFGNVTIPDVCLEQSSPITVWIYEINGTEGRTLKSAVLNVAARTRPSKTRDIPQEIADKYTELITEINESIDAFEHGQITVEKAVNSQIADFAKTAGNAESAAHSGTSECASKTVSDSYGNELTSKYLRVNATGGSESQGDSSGIWITCDPTAPSCYYFFLELEQVRYDFGVIMWDGLKTVYSPVVILRTDTAGNILYGVLKIESFGSNGRFIDGKAKLTFFDPRTKEEFEQLGGGYTLCARHLTDTPTSE